MFSKNYLQHLQLFFLHKMYIFSDIHFINSKYKINYLDNYWCKRFIKCKYSFKSY